MTREVAEHGVKQTYSEENIDSDEDSLCRREVLVRLVVSMRSHGERTGIVQLTELTVGPSFSEKT